MGNRMYGSGEDLRVLDLTSLIVIVGLFFGVAVGNAALFSDPVQVQISIPSKVSDGGFTESAAEQVFAVQVAEMGQALSIVDTPSVQLSTRPTIMAALAKPLNLGKLVAAIQNEAGIDVVTVHGVMMVEDSGKRLDMVTVISMPRQTPVQFTLSEEGGNAITLVQRAAEGSMAWVAPYRLALTYFVRGMHGDAESVARAKDAATTAIARPWIPERPTEHVMLHNLLALMALLDGDVEAAEAQLRVADTIPGADTKARGYIALSQTFLDVAAGRAAEAEGHFNAGKAMTDSVRLRGWSARVTQLGALVAWSRGDMARAERMLRDTIADMPESETGHYYLAQLLEARGDMMGAAAERIIAANSHRLDNDFQSMPLSLFWVDPVHGGMRRGS
jgi:hypothetical protein